MSTLKDKISAGGYIVGSWISSTSPSVAELMSCTGFDFLTVDAEHSPVTISEVQLIYQAIKSGNPNCECMVRLQGVDYAETKRYLDAGAKGVIAPLVNTKSQAEALVQACLYPPAGSRGVGFCRSNQYGLNMVDFVNNANDEIILAVQIEHIEGVENIDDILSVKEIDAVFLGPYDLTASMGITGQFDHPDYLDVRNKVFQACQEHNIVAGIHVTQPNPMELVERVREGYQMLAYSLDITMLQKACVDGLSQIRGALSLDEGAGS